MPRPRPPAPKLYWIAAESAWAVTIAGVKHRLGPDREKAEQQRRRLVAEWHSRGLVALPPQGPADGLTVAEAALAYARHAQGEVCAKQLHRVSLALEHLTELYG